jgi:FkbM family methyltransferase
MTRTSHYCGDYTALTTTKWGAKIYVDTRDTSLAPHIMVDGDWEPWVTNAIAVHLMENKGCLFIDVGANVGWYTLLAAGMFASHVYAFEPNPRMAQLLRKTLAVNGHGSRVTLTQAACGAEPTKAYLVVDVAESGGGHIAPAYQMRQPIPEGPHERAMREALDHAPHICDVVRLDDFILARHLSDGTGQKIVPIIIKIDVEGFEPHVLAGAPELLALRPILFIEHHRDDAHTALLQSLQDQGYILQHVAHTGHPGAPLSVADASALEDAETILCTPRKQIT